MSQEKESVTIDHRKGTTTKTTKNSVDLTNPNFLKPFKYGWRRELVYRGTTQDNSLKRSGDIYYYTPNGRKIRSMRELAENLKDKELALEDFTFAKEPLGLDDPAKEIVRDARYKSSPANAGSGVALGKKGALKAASPTAVGKVS